MITNILWFTLGLFGVLLEFWAGLPEQSGLSAVWKYITTHQRSAFFSLFTYIAVVAIWWTDGISIMGIMFTKATLSGWTAIIGYFSTSIFDDIAKNFSTKNDKPNSPAP